MIGMSDDPGRLVPGLGTGIVDAMAGQLFAHVEIAAANPGTLVSMLH